MLIKTLLNKVENFKSFVNKAVSIEGVMEDGILHKTTKGTPQGGVISPLLANLVGDVIDKELEKAGYKVVRYADDFVVMTKTSEELPDRMTLI